LNKETSKPKTKVDRDNRGQKQRTKVQLFFSFNYLVGHDLEQLSANYGECVAQLTDLRF